MSRIVFVYAGNHDDNRISSPFTITKNVYQFLVAKGLDVVYRKWDDTDEITIDKNDVVLGHPNYSANTPIQRIFNSNQPCRAKCLIHPFHSRRVGDNFPFDNLARAADKIFAICGQYWYDSIEETPFAHWKSKTTRLDMAVDSIIYPYLKHSFNQPGQRRLVYIGSSTPNKNLGYLTQIMRQMKDVELHWYGGDSNHQLAKLPNVRTWGWVEMDAARGVEICRDCDIMVNVSDSDANPTTLLETSAWGLMVACTKESGYYNDPMFTELYLDNPEHTIKAIRELLSASDLQTRSIANRATIETKYCWPRFCETLWSGIVEYFI